MVAHRLLSYVIRSNYDNDCPVHSLILSFHDLRLVPQRRLPSTVTGRMTSGNVSRQRAWPNSDNLRRLTVDNRSSWHPARILTCCRTYPFVLCSLYDMLSMLFFAPVALDFKSLDSSIHICSQRPALASIEHYWQDQWFVQFHLCIFVGKLMAFSKVLLALSWPSVCASLIFISFNGVPSLVCVDPKSFN